MMDDTTLEELAEYEPRFGEGDEAESEGGKIITIHDVMVSVETGEVYYHFSYEDKRGAETFMAQRIDQDYHLKETA